MIGYSSPNGASIYQDALDFGVLCKTLTDDDVEQDKVVAANMLQQSSRVFENVRLERTKLQAYAGCVAHLAHVCSLFMLLSTLSCMTVCSSYCLAADHALDSCLQAVSDLPNCPSEAMLIYTRNMFDLARHDAHVRRSKVAAMDKFTANYTMQMYCLCCLAFIHVLPLQLSHCSC